MQDSPTRRAKPTHVGTPKNDDASLALSINGKTYYHDGDPDMPLLWFLRDTLRLTGTKYGCGIGLCGACSVFINGHLQRACLTPMKAAAGQEIGTLEGLETDNLHPVQQAWIETDVAQCGYCQSGQFMAAVDLLQRKPEPTDADINHIANLCRCGTYPRIRKAIKRAAELMQGGKK